MTPLELVRELDRFIIGQDAAKRAVAIAIRNRWRRRQLAPEIRDEVLPKNIIMIGPTGVGKTEIARRLAQLVRAPFIKVEATKYTEVGYVGRDVDSIIRDLVGAAVSAVREEHRAQVAETARARSLERLVEAILAQQVPAEEAPGEGGGVRVEGLDIAGSGPLGPEDLERLFSGRAREKAQERAHAAARSPLTHDAVLAQLVAGQLDGLELEVEATSRQMPHVEVFTSQGVEQMGLDFQELFERLNPGRKKRTRLKVAEARALFEQEEADKLIDQEKAVREALERVEQDGIVFIDELDKIAGPPSQHGPDVSREGVQRDLLPIVEGSSVSTRHGTVKTDHILFIAAGAFHVSKPSDLIPEMQGRFPIRVELTSLGEEEFVRILQEPQNALVRQYTELLATEGVTLDFQPDGIAEIARMAALVNRNTQNIGARRLSTVMEKLLEPVSFDAPALAGKRVTIDRALVRERLQDILADEDLSRYIL